MDMDLGPNVVDEFARVVRTCDSVARACNAVVSVVSDHTGASVEVLLAAANHLYLVSRSGVRQAPRSVQVNYGIVGRVVCTGRTAALRDASIECADLYVGRRVGSVICAPVRGPQQPVIGVVNVECDHVVADLDAWSAALTEIGGFLGARIHQLGGPPAESEGQQLLRHTRSFAAVDDPDELASLACRAAVEVSGLRCAALLVRGAAGFWEWDEPALTVAATFSAAGSHQLVDAVAALSAQSRSAMIDAACRNGASPQLGDPSSLDARGYETLTGVGVRTLIAAPARGVSERPALEAAMLVMDDLVTQPHPGTVSLVELLMANVAICYEHMSSQRQLQNLAESDPLTGLRHLRPFSNRLATIVPSHTALIAADIDNFKRINDTWGHAAGDRVLTEVANALRKALRDGDEVFRVGGDEFVAILDVPDQAEALRVAERMAAAVAEGGRTISVGVALRHPDEPAEATLRRADEAMYEAKRDGSVSVKVAS